MVAEDHVVHDAKKLRMIIKIGIWLLKELYPDFTVIVSGIRFTLRVFLLIRVAATVKLFISRFGPTITVTFRPIRDTIKSAVAATGIE